MGTNSDSRADEATTQAALEGLTEFRRRTLPTFWRRTAQWKGFDPRRHADIAHDLEHDLVLDCLANATEVVALPRRERHRRWLRLLQHRFYALVQRADRRTERGAEPEHLTAIAGSVDAPALASLGLEPGERVLLARVLVHARHLKNGRLSIEATARAAGVHRREVRALWCRLAERLDHGREWLAFRRQRLAEALCAVAAERLPTCPALHACGSARLPSAADAERRARSILSSLEGRPLDRDLRAHLARLRCSSRRPLSSREPLELLDLAQAVAPNDPRPCLWRVEACLALGDPAGALGAVRTARARNADRAAIVVARCRVLKARGRACAAVALLERARRRGADPRIRAELEAPPLRRAPLRHAPSMRALQAASMRANLPSAHRGAQPSGPKLPSASRK